MLRWSWTCCVAATAIACGDAGAGGGSASAGTTTTAEPTGEPGTTGESVTTGEPVTTGEASSTGPLACPDNLVPAPNSGFCADEATTPNCDLVGPDHADQVCGVPVLAPATALARSSDVEDNAGAGPPDLACLTAPADRPVAPQTVTLEGVVRIVANGCESKQVEIAIYPLVDDGPGPEPIGAPFVTADDCTIAGVASPHPDCGTRHECTYSYPGVPTDTPLVVVTRGVLWAPVHAHDLYIVGAEVQDGKVTRDLRALASDDYSVVAQAALGGPIQAGHGAIVGEVHDCGDVRLVGATVDVEVAREGLVYLDADPQILLPDLAATATGPLGRFAALDIAPGKASVAALGRVDGAITTLGYRRVTVFPDAVTWVTLRGAEPFQRGP